MKLALLGSFTSSSRCKLMANYLPAEKIKESLHEALRKIGPFEECSLLDYPAYLNIGDHLIWLGELFYLTDVLKTKIKYTASTLTFSEEDMERQAGKSPILLQGGGNLGDLYLTHQEFREQIISKYRDRPIVIMPQSIYFANADNLRRAANIFNSHPNLTIFTRDHRSYEIALKHFHKCQIIIAPDMAFQMINMPGLTYNTGRKSSILYHCREDQELNTTTFSSTSINLPDLTIEDWVSYKWKSWNSYTSMFKSYEALPWHIPTAVRLFKQSIRRDLNKPIDWLFWQIMQKSHSYACKFNDIYNPEMHCISWSLLHSGIYQFRQHRLIITNRLHGHILCILLGIPHIFMSNSYYKNESFYETWTYQIPFCRFVKTTSQLKIAAQELLEVYADNSTQPVLNK